MKPFLLYRDRDFGLDERPLSNAADLTADLSLDTLFNTMANGDAFLLDVAKKAVFASLHRPEEVLYRQSVLADCTRQPATIRELYAISVEAVERERKIWGWRSVSYPVGTLHRSVEVLQICLELLKRLRVIADQQGPKFRSEGFTAFFQMFARELDDEYISVVEEHLQRLQFEGGLLMSAELGEGNKGKNYIVRKLPQIRPTWSQRLQGWMECIGFGNGSDYVYELDDRDEGGFRALSELRSRGIAHIAAAVAQATDHIMSFFSLLRSEIGFYVGCLNLHDRLAQKKEPVCFPEPLAPGEPMCSCRGLYDVCLSLSSSERVVGNDVPGDGKGLIIITGANRGGKSTLLRGIGVAQLMMQCGMFVGAEYYRANLSHGVFTHFKREEDAGMTSGKLDEELSRMNGIVGQMLPNSLVLLNESFASTNEREGSEIARQIVHALLESGIKVFYVTHMFDLAHGFYESKMENGLFLRAERLTGGRRTFRLVEGEPLPTSYGEDLYRRIFRTNVTGHVAPLNERP